MDVLRRINKENKGNLPFSFDNVIWAKGKKVVFELPCKRASCKKEPSFNRDLREKPEGKHNV
jgi:hypothetical protein